LKKEKGTRPTMKISDIQDILFLALLAAIFFATAGIELDAPGLGDEEAFLVHPAFCMIKKDAVPRYLGIFWKHHRNFMLMTNAWVGPVSPLLYVPSLALFGPSVHVIRITRLFYGFITIALLFLFAKNFFDRKIAYLSSFLLATFPFYIFLYRHGYLDDGILPTFALATLLCFYAFYKHGKNKFLYWGAFFTGLGLCSKITFLWFIGASILVALLFKLKTRLNKKNIFIACLLFNVAILPMTVFNVYNLHKWNRMEGSTIGAIINNVTITRGGNNNLYFHKNFMTRFTQLQGIFNNRHGGTRIRTHPFYFYLFIVALSFYIIKFIVYRKDAQQTKIALIASFFLILFFFSCFTINYFKIEHAAIYLPFAILVIAKFLNDVFESRFNVGKIARKTRLLMDGPEKAADAAKVLSERKMLIAFSRKKSDAATAITVALVTFFNYATLIESYKILYTKGLYPGQFNWTHPSTAVYTLSEYLVQKGIQRPLVIGPELTVNVDILTHGNVKPRMCLSDNDYYELIKSFLEQSITEKDRYYLVVAQGFAQRFINTFQGMLIRYGKTIDIVKIFYRKDGVPNIILFKLKDGQYSYELDQYIKISSK